MLLVPISEKLQRGSKLHWEKIVLVRNVAGVPKCKSNKVRIQMEGYALDFAELKTYINSWRSF